MGNLEKFISSIVRIYRQNENLVNYYEDYIEGNMDTTSYFKYIKECSYNEKGDFQVQDFLWELKKKSENKLLEKNVVLLKKVFGESINYTLINSLSQKYESYIESLLRNKIFNIEEILDYIKKRYNDFNIHTIEEMRDTWMYMGRKFYFPKEYSSNDVILLLKYESQDAKNIDEINEFLLNRIGNEDKNIYSRVICKGEINWNGEYFKNNLKKKEIDVEFNLEYYFTWYNYLEKIPNEIKKYIISLINENPIYYINFIFSQYYPYTSQEKITQKLFELGIPKIVIELSMFYNIKYNNMDLMQAKIREFKIDIESLSKIFVLSLNTLDYTDTAFILKEINDISNVEEYEIRIFELLVKSLEEEFIGNKVNANVIKDFSKVLLENKEIENESLNILKNVKLKKINFIAEAFQYLIPESSCYYDFLRLMYEIPLIRYCREVYIASKEEKNYKNNEYIELINKYEKYNINIKNTIKIHIIYNMKVDKKSREAMKILINERTDLILSVIKDLSDFEKIELYKYIYKINPKLFCEDINDLLCSKSRRIGQMAVEIVKGEINYFQKALKMCQDENSNIKETGVILLASIDTKDSRKNEMFSSLYIQEINNNIKEIIEEYYFTRGEDIKNKIYSKEEILTYFKKNVDRMQECYSENVSIKNLPNIRWFDNVLAPEVVKKFMVYSYGINREVKRNKEWTRFKKYFSENDIEKVSKEFFEKWLKSGISHKTKWSIALASENGDIEIAYMLIKLIEKLRDEKKYTMICHCVSGIRLIKEYKKIEKEILDIYEIEDNQAVKNHIREVFQGEIVFPKEVINQGIILSKDDKGIHEKEILQYRIEESLVKCNLWNKEGFYYELKDDPKFLEISKSLIWVYENNNNKTFFTVKDIGNFIDYNGNGKNLGEEGTISIVHPTDIKVMELEKWRDYFQTNGILNIINQIDRPIYMLSERELLEKACYKFYGESININKFEKALKERGWDRKENVFTKRYLTFRTIVSIDYGYDEKLNTMKFYIGNILSKNQKYLKEINYRVISESIKEINESLN